MLLSGVEAIGSELPSRLAMTGRGHSPTSISIAATTNERRVSNLTARCLPNSSKDSTARVGKAENQQFS